MAKKAAQTEGTTAEQVPGKPGEALAKAREERAAKAASEKFVFAADPTEKIPPQAQGIVNILKAAGTNGLSRGDLVKAMEGVVTSRQPLARILTYYQKRLVEVGAVKIA